MSSRSSTTVQRVHRISRAAIATGQNCSVAALRHGSLSNCLGMIVDVFREASQVQREFSLCITPIWSLDDTLLCGGHVGSGTEADPGSDHDERNSPCRSLIYQRSEEFSPRIRRSR